MFPVLLLALLYAESIQWLGDALDDLPNLRQLQGAMRGGRIDHRARLQYRP